MTTPDFQRGRTEVPPAIRSDRDDDALDAATSPALAVVAEHTDPGVAAPVRRGRLLIIDDEVVFSASLRRLFSGEHDVTVANRGRDAIALLRAGVRFDAILCDLAMPEVSGIELYGELRRFAPDLVDRIVFLTGGAFSQRAQDFLDGIGNPCFEKPCNLELLRDAVRDVVVRNSTR